MKLVHAPCCADCVEMSYVSRLIISLKVFRQFGSYGNWGITRLNNSFLTSDCICPFQADERLSASACKRSVCMVLFVYSYEEFRRGLSINFLSGNCKWAYSMVFLVNEMQRYVYLCSWTWFSAYWWPHCLPEKQE